MRGSCWKVSDRVGTGSGLGVWKTELGRISLLGPLYHELGAQEKKCTVTALCRLQVQDQAVSRCQQGWFLLSPGRGGGWQGVWKRVYYVLSSCIWWLLVIIGVPDW